MRLGHLRQALVERELDAILVSQPENMRYLSGFTGGEGYLLITDEDALLATDFRYYEQVEREAPAFRLAKITTKFESLLPQMVTEVGAHRVGFEGDHVTYERYQSWVKTVDNCEWISTKGIVEDLRMIKDESELAAIRRAVALADEAVVHIMEMIHPGMTEKQVSWELESYMRTHGADQVSFTIIVGAGPNGAMPHAVTTDRPIEPGEPIIMDLGAKVDGYCSDLTRTFCIGQPRDDKYLEVWSTVLAAQQAARKAMRAGMPGKEAHEIASKVIDDAGYGDYLGHGLGHGVGLQIHERPRAGRLSEDTLLPGAVITIEPGIYLPGWGGVRIEDMVVIRETDAEVLTKAPKRAIVN